jgi:competence ComEA-like helix-hairpin-helix protein
MRVLLSLYQKCRQHRKVLALAALGLLIALIVASLLQKAPLRIQSLQPLPQYPLIQVYMNHVGTSSYTEPDRKITRTGDDLEQVMITAIRSARYSIDLAVQEFRLYRIAQAIAERQQAGVRVRVVMENSYTRPWSTDSAGDIAALDSHQKERYQEWQKLVDANMDGKISQREISDRDVLSILNQNKVLWLDDTADGSKGSGLMHHKFIVIDGQTVVATSANFTSSDVHGDLGRPDTRGNANSLLVIQSRDLATAFTKEFDYLWGDGPGGKSDSLFGVKKPFRPTQNFRIGEAKVALKFSPTSAQIPWEFSTNGLIDQTLGQAQQAIALALFVFSDQRLGDRLHADHKRGIGIRLLVDPGFVYRDFSEVLDMLGVAMANTRQAKLGKCYYEENNRVWTDPIDTVGTPTLPEGDKLHHKYGQIDQNIVIVGSHNWSESANRNNDEFLLVIDHPQVAAHYKLEFERLYASSKLGVPKFLQTKIDQQLQQCGGVIQVRNTPASPTPLDETTGSVGLATPSPESTAVGLVNLNTATEAELNTLPGVGPKLAQAIIEARTRKPFQSLADLDAVPGVGPHVLKTLQNRVTW